MVLDRLFADDEEAADAGEPGPQADPDQDAATIRQAVSAMGSLSREQRRFLAGYAYVLVRVARADVETNHAEITRIEEAVTAAGDLSGTQGTLLVALASRIGSLYGTSEDYTVTRAFARSASPQERQRLLRACVAVAVADGPMTSAETAELYEIGRELDFSVEEIDAIRDQVDPREPEPGPPSTTDR